MPNLIEYVWDPALALYRRKSDDEIVSESQIDEWIDAVIAALALLWRERAASYRAGEIDFETFFTETRVEIENLHRLMIALAFGGANLAQERDYNRLREAVEAQLAYFYAFALQIRAEQVSPAMIDARLLLYALAAYGVHQNAKVVKQTDAGSLVYRRNLGAADHCEDCVEYASRGWQIIGTLPAIGQSVCRSRCHCWFQFSKDLTLLGKGATLPVLNP